MTDTQGHHHEGEHAHPQLGFWNPGGHQHPEAARGVPAEGEGAALEPGRDVPGERCLARRIVSGLRQRMGVSDE